MAVLECIRCGATAEGKDFEECDSLINHEIGTSKGRPCAGKPSDLRLDGKVLFTQEYVPVADGKAQVIKSTTPKSKK